MTKKNRIILLLIFALSISIRFSLAVVNREANDNHMDSINFIIQHAELPLKEDCAECAHPKLFYSINALALKTLSITDPTQSIIATQMINFLMSVVMLWFLWHLIDSFKLADDPSKLLTFGLLALNPALAAINAQATNDTFVITFSVIAIYFAQQFIEKKQLRTLTFTILFSVLAIISKANAIITTCAIGMAIALEALAKRDYFIHLKKNKLVIAGIYGISVLLLVVLIPTSQVIANYQKYGTPFTFNMSIPLQPLPHFFEKTDTYKPGILSIQDGFFTFKYIDLLIEPQITVDNKVYPPHRTSFWTILYGRTHFVQYSQWPPSWETSNKAIRWLGRIIYIFALLPTLMFIIGMVAETKNLIQWFWAKATSANAPAAAGLFLVHWIGILVFAIALSLQYRTFNNIKAIYIYPAIASLAVFFMLGWNTLDRWLLSKHAWLKITLRTSIVILIGLYVLDLIALFLQLQ